MGRDPQEFPIAITGMHRSGTSMITRALHDSGLHLVGSGAEDLIDAAEDNPEGFWENKAIVACNDALLEATGGSWDNPPALAPQAVDDPRVVDLAESTTAALTALSEHEPWGFKDPRACLTAAYWLDLEPKLKFIICVRHPLEVALSLKRRNQNSYSLGLALWERYYTSVLQLVPPERRIVTHYDTFFVDPVGEVERLCAFAGLEAVPPRVRSDLRHHTVAVSLGDAGVGPNLRALYSSLCRESGAPVVPEPPDDEGRVRRLILDGAVAVRHAEQRQAAIERLQEREEQFRAEHRETEAALRERVRGLDQRLRSERASMEADHRRALRDLERTLERTRADADRRLEQLSAIADSTAQALSTVKQIDARTRETVVQLDRVAREVAPGPIRRIARRSGGKARRLGARAVRETKRDAASAALPGGQSTARRAPSSSCVGFGALPSRARRTPSRARRWFANDLLRGSAPRPAPAHSGYHPPRSARSRPPGSVCDWSGRHRSRRRSASVRRLPPPALAVVQRAWRTRTDLRRSGVIQARRARREAEAGADPEGPRAAPVEGRVRAHGRGSVARRRALAGRCTGEPARGARRRGSSGDAVPGRPKGPSARRRSRAHRSPGDPAMRGVSIPRASRGIQSMVPAAGRAPRSHHRHLPDPGRPAGRGRGLRPRTAGRLGVGSLRAEVMGLAARTAHSPAVLDWTGTVWPTSSRGSRPSVRLRVRGCRTSSTVWTSWCWTRCTISKRRAGWHSSG